LSERSERIERPARRASGSSGSPSGGPPLPYILIGNPENRRVTLFQAALARQGLPPATVVAWLDLLRDRGALDRLPDAPALVRVEATGENFAVAQALLAHGYEEAAALGVETLAPRAIADASDERGRIWPPRQLHLGFQRLLAELATIFAAHPRWHVLNDPRTIADLFDKRITSRRYAQLGVPVPPPLDGIDGYARLRARLAAGGPSHVYVKLACGSSAACLGVYHLGRDHEYLMTTIEETPSARYNSRRIRRINDRRRIAACIDWLCREGSQVEAGMPKARLDGRFFDCRVLVVDGEPAFVVARASTHPITNLQLGARRGDPARLDAIVPAASRAAAMDSCRRVWRAHASFQVGVDLMYEPGFAQHRVLEANAFGDLLPNLQRDGLDVYEWQIRRAQARFA
jgi:hypothetical protein